MKTSEDYELWIRFGKKRFGKYVRIPLLDVGKLNYGLSKSETKRLIDQGGVHLLIPEWLKIGNYKKHDSD